MVVPLVGTSNSAKPSNMTLRYPGGSWAANRWRARTATALAGAEEVALADEEALAIGGGVLGSGHALRPGVVPGRDGLIPRVGAGVAQRDHPHVADAKP